ncbi:hypothetical protein GCM10023091_36740 [Ravibacter arvi]|uniref:Uncharacterized protein n=2 Tax=Ravibacter arvi TaxID=2051041 RepID=A0ABP8M9V0_9BACT
MHVARFGGIAEAFFKNAAASTLRRKRRYTNEIVSKAERVVLNSREFLKIKWDSDLHDRVIERIARGLFYYHYSARVPDSYRVKAQWFNKEPDWEIHEEIQIFSIANGEFKYGVLKVEESADSIWLFEFYKSHWASAIIADNIED